MSYILSLLLVLCGFFLAFFFFRITFKVMLFTLIQDCCYCSVDVFTGSFPAKHHPSLKWLATTQ